MSSGRKRILSAALLLPIVLFSTMWTSFALWRCQSDGVTRSHCCCPAKSAPVATISRQACCGIERVDLARAPAELTGPRLPQPTVSVAPAPVPLSAAPALALAPPRALDRPPAGNGPPTGRSLVLHKRSLLI